MASALGAFTGVRLNDQELIVDGISDMDIGVTTSIEVAVISTEDGTKRLQGSLVAEPAGAALASEWEVKLLQADVPRGAEPFADKEPVLVVGVATLTSGERFLWGGKSINVDGTVTPTILVVLKT